MLPIVPWRREKGCARLRVTRGYGMDGYLYLHLRMRCGERRSHSGCCRLVSRSTCTFAVPGIPSMFDGELSVWTSASLRGLRARLRLRSGVSSRPGTSATHHVKGFSERPEDPGMSNSRSCSKTVCVGTSLMSPLRPFKLTLPRCTSRVA
ncbi:hypothetical protein OH77DRAFT_1422512 [Trametes cingulata]|nr:hypothetical protein OH77DRAFT_1422512 [Trametes cingulata]